VFSKNANKVQPKCPQSLMACSWCGFIQWLDFVVSVACVDCIVGLFVWHVFLHSLVWGFFLWHLCLWSLACAVCLRLGVFGLFGYVVWLLSLVQSACTHGFTVLYPWLRNSIEAKEGSHWEKPSSQWCKPTNHWD
jgi:hypothetical protein